MPTKQKRRVRAGAIGYFNRFFVDHSAVRSRVKAQIVRLAVRELIPADFATWLIQRGGLKDA